MQKTCNLCNLTFTKRPTESSKYWETKKFCSQHCARQFESIEHAKTLPTKVCRHCGVEFIKQVKLSKKQWEEKSLCSRNCAYQDLERKKKIGKASLGNEHNKGKVPYNKGKSGLFSHSTESKEKLSRIHKQRVLDGKNHLWKGGITPTNKQIRGCQPMREWKKQVFKKDNYMCVVCNKKGVGLQADHIIEYSTIRDEFNIKNLADALKCKKLWDVNNGQVLCSICHKEKTKKYMLKNWQNQYTKNAII